MTMKTEIELKLEMAPEALQRLRRHPLVKAHRQGRAVTRTLENTYYDTPDGTLLAHGASLRVRRVGRQRLQTVKVRNGTAGRSHFDRAEWEGPLPSEAPDAGSLTETPLPGLLGDSGLAALRPMFTTRFRRTTYRLAEAADPPAWEVELTLDDGTAEAGDRQMEIREAELELVKGTPGDLYRLARGLSEGEAIRLGTRTKADRGYELLGHAPPGVPKAPSPGLRKRMTAIEAVQAIGDACLDHYLGAEDVLRREHDPEAIHQMRVALRRLRSALTLFGPLTASPDGKRLKDEIKWLAGELGRARDLDVFMEEVLTPVRARMPETAGLESLRHHVEGLRSEAYAQAVAASGSARAGALLLDLAAWLRDGDWLTAEASHTLGGRPIRELATEILERRARKVRKTGRGFKRLDAPHRHRVRIEVKKLRYALDFFGGLFKRRPVKAYRRHLATLQDSLGGLNDIAVAHRLLHDLTVGPEAPRGTGRRDMAFAAGLVGGWHEAEGRDLNSRAEAAWAEFKTAAPFWR